MAKIKRTKKSLKKLKNFKRGAKGRSKQVKRKAKTLGALSTYAKLFFVLAVFAFSLALLFYLIPNRSIQSSSAQPNENAVAPPKQEKASPGLPVRLKIPKIKVDAAVDSVGLTRQGAVGVPKGPLTVAWFNVWPRPGENGNAVITGHYGPWITGQRSVFDNINKLAKGDKLYVKDDKGTTITFVVREIKTYTLKSDASEVFISTDGKSHLNLITCVGTWNKKTKLYSNRLVVFTDRE
ncbi:MAG: class F sortase [Patescibacteria group bacterium]